MIVVRELIRVSLEKQRLGYLKIIKESPFIKDKKEDFRKSVENFVFKKSNLLEFTLDNVGLTTGDIDCTEFRDYQHETVTLCVELAKKLNYIN